MAKLTVGSRSDCSEKTVITNERSLEIKFSVARTALGLAALERHTSAHATQPRVRRSRRSVLELVGD